MQVIPKIVNIIPKASDVIETISLQIREKNEKKYKNKQIRLFETKLHIEDTNPLKKMESNTKIYNKYYIDYLQSDNKKKYIKLSFLFYLYNLFY